MNAVRLVFTYPDLNAYEQDEARDTIDPDYARALADEIYRETEPS